MNFHSMRAKCKFLSTPSARRATNPVQVPIQHRAISIHALREEGDCLHLWKKIGETYISIHALREEGDCA